jgi:hypothetical protein
MKNNVSRERTKDRSKNGSFDFWCLVMADDLFERFATTSPIEKRRENALTRCSLNIMTHTVRMKTEIVVIHWVALFGRVCWLFRFCGIDVTKTSVGDVFGPPQFSSLSCPFDRK